MHAFEFAEPESVKDAVALLDGTFATEVLAGGTDLLSMMKDFLVEPARVVSLQRIAALRAIEERDGMLVLGATATIADLLRNEAVARRLPGLVQAAGGIRGAQMRNMGTVGGELLQRPRCWYFRRGYGLLAQQDGQSMVAAGDNRHHAILGNGGPAKYVHPSSLAPALVALGAEAVLAGKSGERIVPVEALFRVPANDGERETTRAPDEILTAIRIPLAPAMASACFEVRHRHGLDWPEAAAACALELDGGTVKRAAIVLGHVAPTPWLAKEAADALAGKPVDAKSADAAAEAALAGATPLSKNGAKVGMAKTAVRRAVLLAADPNAAAAWARKEAR